MYWDSHAVRLEICLEIGENGTLSLSETWNSIIPKAVHRMGARQSVEALQLLAYIGLTRNNEIHVQNGREVHLPWVPNVKFDGQSAVPSVFFTCESM